MFIVAALAVMAITAKALNSEWVEASVFMEQLAVDTGLFVPFSPLSFQYYPLNPYGTPLAVGAVLCGLAAGAVLRTRQNKLDVRGGKVDT